MNKGYLLMTIFTAAGLGLLGGYWLSAIDSDKVPPNSGAMINQPRLMNTEPAKPLSSRTILYYKNPMGLPDTSQVPKKDGMGMDYVPVYADDGQTEGAGTLSISAEKIQKLGVKTTLVERREIAQTIRSVGIIEVDERHMYNVALKFDGYIEKLLVNTTGESVTQGQPLLELYSPELVSAQQEYLTARKASATLSNAEPWLQSGMENMTLSSLERLRNWGVSNAELAALDQTGKARHNLTIRSTVSGIVMEKIVIEGSRVAAGEVLYKIADLSKVWAIGDINEQDIGLIELGQVVQVRLVAYPTRTFQGKVSFIYPQLNQITRTARIRVELPNPQNRLKPMMYAQLELAAKKHRSLSVPSSALLESGRRTLVLIDKDNGTFEPRLVKPGLRGEDFIEIVEGVSDHEKVVTAANFLIDAESNLRAAIAGFNTSNEPPNFMAKPGVQPEPSMDAGKHDPNDMRIQP